jgi:hypothetical protein
MGLIKWFLNLFKEQEESKGSNLGSFVHKVNDKRKVNNVEKNTWTGPYRRR